MTFIMDRHNISATTRASVVALMKADLVPVIHKQQKNFHEYFVTMEAFNFSNARPGRIHYCKSRLNSNNTRSGVALLLCTRFLYTSTIINHNPTVAFLLNELADQNIVLIDLQCHNRASKKLGAFHIFGRCWRARNSLFIIR